MGSSPADFALSVVKKITAFISNLVFLIFILDILNELYIDQSGTCDRLTQNTSETDSPKTSNVWLVRLDSILEYLANLHNFFDQYKTGFWSCETWEICL